MDARANEKKPTRSERLTLYKIADEEIPEKYIDHVYTKTILEKAGEVDGKIVDLVFFEQWQEKQIREARANNAHLTDAAIRKICLTNPYTRNPYFSYHTLPALDSEIEEWLDGKKFLHELKVKAEKDEAAKKEKIKKVDELSAFIEQLLNSLSLKLKATTDEDEAQRVIAEIAKVLHIQEKLPDEKEKLKMGSRYFNDPVVIQRKIDELCSRAKDTTLTELELTSINLELKFWAERLDVRGSRNFLARSGIAFFNFSNPFYPNHQAAERTEEAGSVLSLKNRPSVEDL